MRKWIFSIAFCLVMCMAMSLFCSSALAEQTEMTNTVEEEFYARFRIDPENAERQYLNKLFGLPVTPPEELAVPMRGYVSGDSFETGSRERILYNALRNRVEQVAAGSITSTQFSFTGDDFAVMEFTATDLGLSSGEIFDSDGNLSQSASQKIGERISTMVTNVVQAVLYDCPYETFWRDQRYKTDWSMGWYLDSQGESIEPIVVGSVSVTIYVSDAYQNKDAGEAASHTVDYSRISSAISAVNNAQAIIDANANLGNYAKLTAYKDAICGLTDYNTPAADPGWTGGYGDPWQLVWVFDNDPETTVVCEGYSKAFYYLCDKSQWNGDVQVICVSGDMWTLKNNAWKSGAHMWNIVRLNGQNYMADVTNTDSGNEGLFLDGYDRYDENNDIYFYTSGTYASGDIREIGYSFDDSTIALYQDNGWLALSTTDAEPGAYLSVSKASVEAGEDITISAYLPGAGHIRVGTQEGVFVNDYFTEIQEGDTATWTTFFDYPGEYTLFLTGWSDERWNNPEIPNVTDFPDMGYVGYLEVPVTVTAQEEQGPLPEATVTIPEPLNRYRTIEVEIPEFPDAMSYSVVCMRTDTRETVYSRTEDGPFDESISCEMFEENIRYGLKIKVRRDGYASYVYYESFLIWAPIVPESITPGEDMTITLPPKEGAALYEISIEGQTNSIIYYVTSAEYGDFVIPAMVFADGAEGFMINIRVCRENDDPEAEWPYEEMYWGNFERGAEAYAGEQTLIITAGAYDDGLQTINLSVTDADQVIVQEKEINYWGYECWPTVNVTDNPGAAVNISLPATGEHEIRAAVKKDGVWSAWSPVIEITTTIHGRCNEDIEWALSDSGILTISGTGALPYDMDDPWDQYSEEITEVKIGEGITGIQNYVFGNYTNLTTVTIPASLTSIGEGAFCDCENLTGISNPGADTTTHKRCYDSSIKVFSLPSTVEEIGYAAFYNTPAFGENTPLNPDFEIPTDTGRIEEYAFYGIAATHVKVTSYDQSSFTIKDYAFGDCDFLRYFQVDDWYAEVDYNIAEHAFDGCTNLTFIGVYNEELKEFAEEHGFVYLENEAIGGNE